MSRTFHIFNALVVNEGSRFPGGVLLRDGVIEEIFRGTRFAGENLPEKTVAFDAQGKMLLPGVIDDHVHFREPGLTRKGDLRSESRAAVAGGITSFMEMPNTVPNATNLGRLEEKFSLAAVKSLANYSFFLGATNDNIAEIERADPSKVCGVKLFMGASTGNMLVDDPRALEDLFKRSPLPITVHAEEETVIRKNLEEFRELYGDEIPASAHPLIRTGEACLLSSRKAVGLAEKYPGSRLHLAHLSTAAELTLLRNDIPLEEKQVTGEACIHHLWFDDRDYPDLGARIKWNPAIKTSSDREALFAGVLSDRIDVIATDHAPHLASEKDNPYASCPSGGPMVQHALVAMLGFYHLGRISVEKIVEKMCHAPARLYAISGRGFIRRGYAADLVLVDPDDPWIVTRSNIFSKCGWSPMEGVTFRSRVTHTWVNGHLVYEDGSFDESEKGRRLVFER